jgi:hypothetical protein
MPLNSQPSGGSGGPSHYDIVTSRESTNSTTNDIIGVRQLSLEGDHTFNVVAAAPAGLTMNVRVTDITDGAGGVELLSLSTPEGSTAPEHLTGTVTPIDGEARLYAVEIRLSGGQPSVSDRGICYSAYLEEPA